MSETDASAEIEVFQLSVIGTPQKSSALQQFRPVTELLSPSRLTGPHASS